MGRIGYSSETKAVAAFLASNDSRFMTGSDVFVDGGYAKVYPAAGKSPSFSRLLSPGIARYQRLAHLLEIA